MLFLAAQESGVQSNGQSGAQTDGGHFWHAQPGAQQTDGASAGQSSGQSAGHSSSQSGGQAVPKMIYMSLKSKHQVAPHQVGAAQHD
jgi:hypothetical protein